MSPRLIINGHNGLMYFSMDGGSLLGAIVADADGLDRPAGKSAAAAALAGAEGPAEPARLTKKERAQQRKRERKAEAKAAAGSAASAAAPKAPAAPRLDSSEEEGFESDASEEASASASSSFAAAAPGPSLASPAAPVAPEVGLHHILEQHRFGAPNDKGQFLEGMAPEQIRALVLESLARREIPLIRNLEGRWETHHSFPEAVGFYLDWRTGNWRTTCKLRVVLNPDQTTVLTAFPVRP
jgi:hypothetical protein